MFNSRSVPNDNLHDLVMTGASSSILEGVIYAPSGKITFSGNEDANATYAMVIGDHIEIMGNPNLDISGLNGSGRTNTAPAVAIVE